MLKILTGIGIALITAIPTETPICTADEGWAEAEISSVTVHEGLYGAYYEVTVVDANGWTYIIDDLDADYVESNEWITGGHRVLIQADDGFIEDMAEG